MFFSTKTNSSGLLHLTIINNQLENGCLQLHYSIKRNHIISQQIQPFISWPDITPTRNVTNLYIICEPNLTSTLHVCSQSCSIMLVNELYDCRVSKNIVGEMVHLFLNT